MENLACDLSLEQFVTQNGLIAHERRYEYENFCLWKGVVCDINGLFVEIRWLVIHTMVDHTWNPPYLRVVTIRKAAVAHPYLNTRLLPRRTMNYRLIDCFIQGSIDLRSLPNFLEVLDLSLNRISGVVDMTYLPFTIRSLNYVCNRLTTVFITSNLPMNF